MSRKQPNRPALFSFMKPNPPPRPPMQPPPARPIQSPLKENDMALTAEEPMRIKLGDRVRDSITGFCGIATAKAEYLFGCERICIQPESLKDGKSAEQEWFDIQRIEIVDEDDAEKPVYYPQSEDIGGDYHEPPEKNRNPK